MPSLSSSLERRAINEPSRFFPSPQRWDCCYHAIMIASIQWRAAFLALLPVIPVPLSPYLSGLAFSPRGVIHSHEILPLFFAVFAPPTGELAIATRLIQSVLLCHLSLNTPLYIWAFTCTLCLIRCLVGFTLTRSVGWAAPAWFSHYSLYEPLAGLGPGLYAYLTIIDNDLPEHLPPLLAVTFCWMENAPWTYGISILVANAVKLLLLVRVGGMALTKESPDATNVTTRSSGTTSATTPLFEDAGLPAPAVQQGEKSAQVAVAAYSPAKPTVSIAACTRYGLLPLLATLPYFLIPAARLPFPEDTSLEVLVLSFPRPIEVDLAAAMINTTINSFVPFLSPPSITMSVFTHSAQHEALRLVSNSHPHIAFHADQDSHPEDVDGHYLHLAEAFRWAGEKRRAEWYMLVEDDFPVCKGGWDVIATVMNMLESQRADQSVDAGFIGTGGR